ncbi:MAG: tRNA (N6-isopentenyl adenosine(37)-C2)-methylthiotransferase MiaB [Spirochaetales bacterium]|nr:tRNA (N6-isopentenyl adenosine(37)-C2)-methylthiotransferase MiaB [Spirochaetales bacterium]
MKNKHFWIETYGCQMNEAESEALKILLKEKGWLEARSSDNADAVILNTCSVRQTAENRLWGRIGYYKHAKKEHNFKLAVMGCMAERLKDSILKKVPEIDLIVGNFQKHRAVDYLEDSFSGSSDYEYTEPGEYNFFKKHSNENFKAFIPIMHGCNNFCTYCIVPYVRGREVSRSPEDILKEIEKLESENVKEITLLGQNVNSYLYRNKGETTDFASLLKMITDNIHTIKWVRFLTSHPKDLSDRVIEIMKEKKVLCKQIHLPVQHGSNKILKAMKRGYTRESYISLAEKIRKKLEGVSITTDILIGFPGETEEDLQLTMDLMKRVEYEDAFTYYYNPREGTKAFELGDTVLHKVKIERLRRIIELQNELTRKKKIKKIGQKMTVLAEKLSKKNSSEILARTEFNDMVVFPGSEKLIGNFVMVKIKKLSGNTLIGEEIPHV